MNKFVTHNFFTILRRDYGFDPKMEETSSGTNFTITVKDPALRKFMREKIHYPKTVGMGERLDGSTKVQVPIIKDMTFIHNAPSGEFDKLEFCLDKNGDTGAMKINAIEHSLRTFMASRRSNHICI